MGFHRKPVHPAAHRHGDVAACPDCGTVITDSTASRVNPVARSRGVPQEVQPLCCAPVDADPPAQFVRQRPVLGRPQSLEAHPDHRGSHRAEADAEVR